MASDGEDYGGFQKFSRHTTGLRHGIKSKSKVSRPTSVRRQSGSIKGAMDTFSIQSRHGSVVNQVEIDGQHFSVSQKHELTLQYSLNKKKRWEMFDTMHELVEEDVHTREKLEKERRIARGLPVSDEDSATSSREDSDSAEEGASPFHVVDFIDGVSTTKQRAKARHQFLNATKALEEGDEPRDFVIIKTRKGRKVVPAHKVKPTHTPEPEPNHDEVAQAQFLVQRTLHHKKNHKHVPTPSIGCNCEYCKPRRANAGPRAHKYRFEMDQ